MSTLLVSLVLAVGVTTPRTTGSGFDVNTEQVTLTTRTLLVTTTVVTIEEEQHPQHDSDDYDYDYTIAKVDVQTVSCAEKEKLLAVVTANRSSVRTGKMIGTSDT